MYLEAIKLKSTFGYFKHEKQIHGGFKYGRNAFKLKIFKKSFL